MKDPYRHPALEQLLHSLAALSTPEEVFAVLEDLCTVREIQDMCQRLETARLLDEGMSYQAISDEVGVSTATISRVSRCLNYGSGGYREILNRMKSEESSIADP